MKFLLRNILPFALFLFLFGGLNVDVSAQIFRKKKGETTETQTAPPTEKAEPAQPTAPQPATSEAASGAMIDFAAKEYDFGQVKQGDLIQYSFKFTNRGNSVLYIRSVKPGCGCTVAENWPQKGIAPGETASIEVKFNSAGKMGKQRKAITVYTNQEPNNMVVLYLTGEVINPGLPPR